MIKKLTLFLVLVVMLAGITTQVNAYPSFQCTSPPYDQVVDPATGKIYGSSTSTCQCCQNNNYNPTGCTQDVRVQCNSVPINSNLIFLIIAGMSIGGLVLYRSKANLLS
jgi:hypothetical protein